MTIHTRPTQRLTRTLTGFTLATLALAMFTAAPAMAKHHDHGDKKSKQKMDIVETAAAAGKFNTLLAAAKAAGLVDALKGEGPLTVFAPTDAAFDALPEGTVASLLEPENRDKLRAILMYHVVPGKVKAKQVMSISSATTLLGQRADVTILESSNPDRIASQVFIDDARVVKADIYASNGVIHVIDSVIMPKTSDVVETAASAGSFNTLLAAAKAAGLVETLKGAGPFTIFAPTDAAFDALPEGTVASLLEPENRDKLRAILTYHVVPGRVYSDQISNNQTAATVNGATVMLKTKKGVTVNNANVIAADIEASNGVIHVIDAVILPPDRTAMRDKARRMLAETIFVGSHLYNAGHHEACATKYMHAAQQLLAMNPQPLDDDVTARLAAAVSASESMHNHDKAAWKMRHALDAAVADVR